MRLTRITFTIAIFILSFAPAIHAQTLTTSGVRFWLERVDAMRGPEGYGEDNIYTSFQLPSGSFRNFTSNDCWVTGDGPNCTQALNGTAVWDATASPSTAYKGDGTPTPTGPPYYPDVLHSTAATTWASCGQWLNSVISYGGTLYGFVHGENPGSADGGSCGFSNHHHKTMTLWTSTTGAAAGEQASWLAGPISPTLIIDATVGDSTHESGEGDCTAVNDTTYAYLFCRNPPDTHTLLARAPLTNLTSFIKYDNGWGSQPGVNGTSSELVGTVAGSSPAVTSSALGSSASVWNDKSWAMLLNIEDSNFMGLKVSFTALSNLQTNSIPFTTLPDPLFVQETNSTGGYPYGSNPPHYLYIYPSVLNLVNGTRTWDLTQNGQFLLTYTFVPPQNTLTHRILATRSVTVNKSTTAYDPQVLVALTTRYDSGFVQFYSSTQPVSYGVDPTNSYPTGTFSDITVQAVGYFPQLPPATSTYQPTSQGQIMTKVVECRNTTPWPSGHPDHLVTTGSCDANYNEETVAGYSYPSKPATGNSVQIYRCKSSANGTHWVSSSSTCDGDGTSEASLGWTLTK